MPYTDLVYVPNHPAIQAAASGLATAAGLDDYWYLPVKLAKLLGATNIRPDPLADEEPGHDDSLIANWPEHWFAEWQYRSAGKPALSRWQEERTEVAS